jgi:hypothetical protein
MSAGTVTLRLVAGVPTVLLEQLAAARADGTTFAHAWPPALDVALASSALEREDWAAALEETIDSWRAAFEGCVATRSERALAIVAVDPDRVPIGDRECAHCGGEIPATRGRQGPARYCSPRCKRDAAYARERAALARVA